MSILAQQQFFQSFDQIQLFYKKKVKNDNNYNKHISENEFALARMSQIKQYGQ